MDASGVRFGTSGARGLVSEMTPDLCSALTAAFLETVSVTSGRVALAMDLRPSSPGIAAACAAAIVRAGLSVDNCGAIPTPALAYYAQEQGLPAIMVTGSHIPFDRNGIKFYRPEGEITKADEIAISASVVTVAQAEPSAALSAVNHNARRGYTNRYLDFFPDHCLAGMKLGIYEHSGVARDLLGEILRKLGAEIISLGRTEDFVPIDTEAVSDADTRQARLWADQYGFDAILSTDGDADRPLLGDESGNWMRGDLVGILCAQYLGAEAVATTVNCNTTVDLCGSFSNVVKTCIGSPYVIEGMAQMKSTGPRNVVGFEPNGGFLVGSKIERSGRTLAALPTRDAVLPILCLLSMARAQGCRLSALSRNLPKRFTASNRLQDFPTETGREILSELAASESAIIDLIGGAAGRPCRLDLTDGVRIFLEQDEIVHFRTSGNAPELRCYAESESQERAEFLMRTCLQRLEAKRDLKSVTSYHE
jgi:phosphomannomutase